MRRNMAPPVAATVAAPSGGATVGGDVWAAESWVPRVRGVVESAPVYDEVRKIVAAPHVVGCMTMQVGEQVNCRCATQQGTDAQVSVQRCLQYVRQGEFNPYQKAESAKLANIAYLNTRAEQDSGAGGFQGQAIATAGD